MLKLEKLSSCGFKKWKPCNKKCEYYDTCTRNPNKSFSKVGKYGTIRK